MTISQRIFDLLEKQGRKQNELAEYIGTSTSNVSAWKKRGTDPPASSIFTIADFFHVSLEYILTGQEMHNTSQIKCTNAREVEMMNLFRCLSEQDQYKIIGRLEGMVEEVQTEESAV